jgi:hypothetical protein
MNPLNSHSPLLHDHPIEHEFAGVPHELPSVLSFFTQVPDPSQVSAPEQSVTSELPQPVPALFGSATWHWPNASHLPDSMHSVSADPHSVPMGWNTSPGQYMETPSQTSEISQGLPVLD